MADTRPTCSHCHGKKTEPSQLQMGTWTHCDHCGGTGLEPLKTPATADDTVEAAKQQIVDDAYDGDCTKAELVAHLDALIAAIRAETAPLEHAAFRYALRCNVDGTTYEVTCPDGDIAPNGKAAFMHYLLTARS